MSVENKDLLTINSMLEKEKYKIYQKMKNIESQAGFLLYKGDISEEDFNNIDIKILSICPSFDNIWEMYLDDIINNRLLLSDLYRKTIKLYNQYDVPYSFQGSDLDDDCIKKYFLLFLKHIGCEDLYNTIIEKNMLYTHPHFEGFMGKTMSNGKLSYILVEDSKDRIQFYTVFAHEMGHVLYNHVLYDNEDYIERLRISSEIISILFEKMFIDYLLNNSNIDKELLKSRLRLPAYKYFLKIQKAKKVLDLIDNPHIDFTFDRSIINYQENGENQTLKFGDNLYAIGEIASNKLLVDNENDKDYFIKHLHDVIREIYSLSTEELLSKYYDLNATRNTLDRCLVKKRN